MAKPTETPLRTQHERERELEQRIRDGQLDQAALIARSLGNPRYAAKLFAEAVLPYQSAVCFYEAGDAKPALAAFLAVPKEDPRYRSACVHALRIACELGVLSHELDRFVAEFADTDPHDPHELRALYRLGTLYQANELFEHAREVLRRVARLDPTNTDARQRLLVLDGLLKGTPNVYGSLLRHDASSWRPPRTAGERPPDPQRAPPPLPPPRPAPVAAPAPAATPSVDTSWAVGGAAVPIEPTLISTPDPKAPPTSDLALGTLVANRYSIEKEVGRGGMGIVYRALDRELDLAIALKLFSQPLEEQGLILRFKQELTLCRQLAHPNIVRLYDIGAHAGRTFISMELLEGASLHEVLRRPGGVGRLSLAVSLLRQASAGLGAAHAIGIIHRDVKPENLFLTAGGVLKVTDFGLAKQQGEKESQTMVGFFGGSPNYMAPEQITDFGAVTPAADLYSLGVVAYEMVTGSRPFRHKDRQKVLEMHLVLEPTPPRTVNPNLPQAVEDIVLGLLRKDPAERIATCTELTARLDALTRVP